MGTHYSGTGVEKRALDAFIKFMRAHDSVRARLEPSITRHGITTSQFGVLETLWHLGPMNQRDLGQKLLKSKSNLTTVVDNLEKRGLVVRGRVESDRRQTLVRLTPRGRKLIEKLFPQQLEAIVREFGALTATEQENLGKLCKKLGLRRDPNQ